MLKRYRQVCSEAGDSNGGAPAIPLVTPPPVVPPEEKTIGGIKFYKEQLENERIKREELATELETIKNNKLKEQNNWKDLYEKAEAKSKEYQTKLSSVSKVLVQDKMSAHIEREALAIGILPSALEDLDLLDKSMIEIETTSTGKVNFNNVKEFVESIRAKKPHWFGAHQDPNINTKKPGSFQAPEMSFDEILDLQNKDPKKYNELMQQKLRSR